MNIGSRLTAAFASVLVVIAAGALITTWQLSGAAEDARRIVEIDDRLTAVRELERDIGILSRRISTFVDQEDSGKLLASTRTARSVLNENLAETLRAFRETHVTPPDSLSAATDSVRDELDAIDRLAYARDWQAIRLRVNIQLDQILLSIDEAVGHVAGEVRSDRQKAVEQVTQRQRWARIILLVTTILSLLTALLLGYSVTRSITAPVSELKRAARQLARRDFDLQLDIRSNDEMAEVGRDLVVAGRNLETSYSALKRSNDDLEQFAHAVSHDLREPLRSVTIFSQLLRREYAAHLPPGAAEYLAFVTNAAVRMNELIDGILAYSRLTHSGTITTQQLDLGEVIGSVLKNLHVTIQETKADVKYDPMPTIQGNRVQMIQVFQNLISNAIKYRRAEIPPQIMVSVQEHPGRWVFCVADNGIGVPLEHQTRIFGAFQQIDRTRSGGVGLGLATAKRIIEQHGGDIWIQSDGTNGSRFFFSLPTRT